MPRRFSLSLVPILASILLTACATKTQGDTAPEVAPAADKPVSIDTVDVAQPVEAPESKGMTEVDLSAFFDGYESSFVLLESDNDGLKVHNLPKSQERATPASTYKIPNSLIAMETGIATGPDFTLPFDPETTPPKSYWPETWTQDHSLSSAFLNSVVWYYQELARRIGEESMTHYVNAFDYGNKDIGGGIDQFWLRGNLKISPVEQVAFLRRMYEGALPLKSETVDNMKDILLVEDTPAYRLSGKTGTAMLGGDTILCWFVGYVEVGEEVHYFAMNIEGDNLWNTYDRDKRIAITKGILTQLEIVPATEAP